MQSEQYRELLSESRVKVNLYVVGALTVHHKTNYSGFVDTI